MPEEIIQRLPNKHLMQVDEIEKIAQTFVDLGVNKIRLTGGEPLVRKEFPEILKRIAKLPVEIGITTNGVLVDTYFDNLKAAKVKSINVSLDSLHPKTFEQVTQRNQFERVWNNILRLVDEGFEVKINAVALQGVIEKEIYNFVAITKDLPLHVRLIEFMPFTGNGWKSEKVITAPEMLGWVKEKYKMTKLEDAPHSTAKKYRAEGHKGTFAFITTMSEYFCGSCNRIRLTADGKMKNCLFGKEEMDILGNLRQGKDIESLIHESIQRKYDVMGGQFTKDYKKADASKIDNRSMIKIGG